jgi:hypothetical protein
MRVTNLFENVIIDNVNGLGSVPYNQNINYMGLKVKMKPSTFLDLAAKFEKNEKSYDHIKAHIKVGGAIGAPFLQIRIPEEWENNDFGLPAKVVGHEGRHRMSAILDIFGDDPIEVHLFFMGGLRNRDITDDYKKHLKKGLVKEHTTSYISGPLFEGKKGHMAYDWLSKYTDQGFNKWPNDIVLSYLLKNYPNEETMTLYRGLHFDTKEEYDEFMNNLDGKIDSGGITSWTTIYGTAEDFSLSKKTYYPTMAIMSQEQERSQKNERMTGYRGVVLQTVIEPNTGIDVRRTPYSKEDEVILPKGTYKVKVKTISKTYTDILGDGEETIKSVLEKMIDPKYRDQSYYQNFVEFIKTNYPDKIRNSNEFKKRILQIISNQYKKVDFVVSEVDKFHAFSDYKDVRIYFNSKLFELFDQGFLPNNFNKFATKYADMIVNEYYRLVKKHSGPEYFYEFGKLMYISKYASPSANKKIDEVLRIQVGNAYNALNDRSVINAINKIEDPNEKRKAMKDFTEKVKSILSQVGK